MGSMDKDVYFHRQLKQLEDWYADSVRATDVRPMGAGSHDAGHAILMRNKYPGPDWRRLWRAACGDADAQGGIIHSIEEEIYGIGHAPSQSGPASGLHRGTAEWRQAIANSDGSLRAVARRFGISHTEVHRIRLAAKGAQ